MKNWVLNIIRTVNTHHTGAYAAQAAYFFVLSLIPIFLLLITMVQYTPVTMNDVMELVLPVFPDTVSPLIRSVIVQVYTKSNGFIPFTLLVALWKNTVDLFRSMDIPVRTLECCSGDLADLKVKSVDVEAWSPRQKKYFEVGSCSNLGDAQARRLGIRIKGEKGSYFAHTLNNTVVAPPRMLIAFLENNLQADGSVKIPEVLQPYMGGNKEITPKK